MIKAAHLRHYITDVLMEYCGLELASQSAIELLMLTAAQETHCGQFLYQLEKGPARGIFQIEPWVIQDLQQNFLVYKPQLKAIYERAARGVNASNWEIHLTGNLVYQVVAARLQYFRFPMPLPRWNAVRGLAEYYKAHWNTVEGRASVDEAIYNYSKYA